MGDGRMNISMIPNDVLTTTSGTFNANIKIVQNDEILYSQMMKKRVEVKP